MFPKGKCSLGDKCKAPHAELRPRYKCILNDVVDAELDAIDNQDEDDVFCIDGDSEYENNLLIVPEEENNYTKM